MSLPYCRISRSAAAKAMTLTIAGVPGSNLSGSLAHTTQPGATSLAVPPPGWKGAPAGQRRALDGQRPDTQGEADLVTRHNAITARLELRRERLGPSRRTEDDVILSVQPQVFQDDLPGLLVQVGGRQRVVPAAPVDVGIGLQRRMHASL